MRFAQIYELVTSRWEDVRALQAEWAARTAGVRPRQVGYICADRDQPGRYLMYVLWDSYDEAQRNNALPATHEISTRIAELCDEPVRFRNLDVVAERHD